MEQRKASGSRELGFLEATAIGVGGMVGGGIFAVLGLAAGLAGGGTPVAFLIAGVVALLTAYSYAKLSVTYQNSGGTVVFVDKAFKRGLSTGGLNVLLWLSYIIALSLYAVAFGNYGATFFPQSIQPLVGHILITLIIIALTALNTKSASEVGGAEKWIVLIKVLILTGFVAIGMTGVKWAMVSPAHWEAPLQLLTGGMIIFVAYEGFELIANSSADIADPQKNLPRAYYASVIFVIVLYALIALVTVGTLSKGQIAGAADFVLAEAARPVLGQTGFIIIAVAAMLSTASAINATLYGTARLSYTLAREDEISSFLERRIHGRPYLVGLFITTGLTLLAANLFDLSSISTMGSAGFLIIFAAVNLANVRLAGETHSSKTLSLAGTLACIGALGAIIWQTLSTEPKNLLVLVIMVIVAFGVEFIYRLDKERQWPI